MNFKLPPTTVSKGCLSILEYPLTALFCSNRCPGDLILKTYDLARAMRDAGISVVGGFQTPMEKECLRLLLRGSQPMVICPARGIEKMRVPRDWRPALNEGRLLILSTFTPSQRRPTIETAAQRNELVAGPSSTGSSSPTPPRWQDRGLRRKLAASGKPLLTLGSPANANLLALGARVVNPTDVLENLA